MKQIMKFTTILFILSLISMIPVNVVSTLTTFNDYQFITDTEIQAYSWKFDLTVKEPSWTVKGRILSYQFYQVNDSFPVNYISFVDILIGTGDVSTNTGYYNFSFAWGDRYVNVSFTSSVSESDYVISNIGNIHCIARTQETMYLLKSIENMTMITLSGYLVDVDGWNTTNGLSWETDTEFGNEDCEILVISNSVPSDVTTNDLMVLGYLGIGIVGSFVVVLIIKVKERQACKIDYKRKQVRL